MITKIFSFQKQILISNKIFAPEYFLKIQNRVFMADIIININHNIYFRNHNHFRRKPSFHNKGFHIHQIFRISNPLIIPNYIPRSTQQKHIQNS